MNLASGILILTPSLLLASAGHAAPEDSVSRDEIALRYVSPPACPTEREARSAFLEELVLPIKAPLRMNLEVREVAGIFEGDIEFQSDGEPRQRSIRAANCQALLRAFAVIVGIAENGERKKEQSRERAKDERAPGTPPNTLSDPGKSADGGPVEPGSARHPARSAGVGAGVELGTLPSSAPVLVGHFNAQLLGALGFGVSLFGLPPQEVTLNVRSGAATFFSFGGNLRACAFLHGVRMGVIPCVGLELSALFGSGKNVATASSGTSLNVSPVLSLRIPVRIAGAFALSLGGDLGLAIPRPEFQIASVPVHQRSIVYGRVVLSPEVQF